MLVWLPMPLFSDLKFHLSPSYTSKQNNQLTNLLRAHGGTVLNTHNLGSIYVLDRFEGVRNRKLNYNFTKIL